MATRSRCSEAQFSELDGEIHEECVAVIAAKAAEAIGRYASMTNEG